MRFFFAIILLFLLSCQSKTAVPEGVLPVAKMTELMWEMVLADGLVSHRYPSAREADKFDTSIVLYQQIAKAHGTTQQQVRTSLRFYESRPDLLQIILDSLQKRSMLPAVAYKKDSILPGKQDSMSRKFFQKRIPVVPPSKLP